jgi:hypothetical protein
VPVSTPGAGPSTEQLQHAKSGSSCTSREEGSAFLKPFDHIVHDGYPPTIEVTIPHRLFHLMMMKAQVKSLGPTIMIKGKQEMIEPNHLSA